MQIVCVEDDLRKQNRGMGRIKWGQKRSRQMVCYCAGFHCGQLGPDPAGDPLRNHIEHTSKLSS